MTSRRRALRLSAAASAAPAPAATAVVTPGKKRKGVDLALRADRAAAIAAVNAVHAAIIAQENDRWEFECSCGLKGSNFDDDTDMLQCIVCFRWAHEACARNGLRAPRYSALRQFCYCCFRCAPDRYAGERPVVVDEQAPRNPRLVLVSSTRDPSLAVWLRRDPKRRDRPVFNEVCERVDYERPKVHLEIVPGAPCVNFEIVPGELWLDVGAHVGTFSALALHGGAHVVAVEPDPDNFELLQRNGARHASRAANPTTFRPVFAAVSENAEETTLFHHPKGISFRHSTHASRKIKGWPEIQVPAITLQTLLDSHPGVVGVKLDCQGAEIAAVDSIRDWGRVSKLVLEYDFEYAPCLDHFHAFISRLKSHFSLVHHPKLKSVGTFVGFPNGVLVFALRHPSPPCTNNQPTN
ncbi:hypothetical protein CTAYLR_004588 [Chrysophaeum taylorii]|uniref:Methyltransferase FkbM domain-containing protein n=1 Tax=Chrysophaeum taylorii TaxID=2483200 RepID=A0AAD7XP72_9STRA|nr:hypothetical protein CTAYLR_004588 [Chrysophaeum taylorii]